MTQGDPERPDDAATDPSVRSRASAPERSPSWPDPSPEDAEETVRRPWGFAQPEYRSPYPQAPNGQQQHGQQQYGQRTQAGYLEPFPPIGPVPTQPPLSEADARLWSTLAHLLIPVTGFVAPLLIWALLRDRSRLVGANATEALNFAILYSIAQIVSGLLTLVVIGYVLVPAVFVVVVVFAVMGAVAANRGEEYRYPLNWRPVDR